MPARGRGKRQVFCGAAQAYKQMVVVRIDHRCPAIEVRPDRDEARRDRKLPWLRIVAVGSERGVTDQFARVWLRRERGARRLHRSRIVGR